MKLRALTVPDGETGDDAALLSYAVDAMEIGNPLLQHMEWVPGTGSSHTAQADYEVNGFGGYRATDADYTPVTASGPEVTAVYRTIGGVVKTDMKFLRQYPGSKLGPKRRRDLAKACTGYGRLMMNEFVNADGTSGTVLGIKASVDAGQKISMGTNGSQILLGNSDTAKSRQQDFLSRIDELVGLISGTPTVLLARKEVWARLKAIAREYVTVTSVTDALGQPTQLLDVGGIPLISSGRAADNVTEVIGQNETVGTNNDCTSIYAIRFAEDDALANVTTTGLVVKNQGLVQTHYCTLVELDWNTMLNNKKAIACINGIRL